MKINWYLVTTQYIDTEPWQRHTPPLLLREYLGGRRKGGKLIAGLKIPVKKRPGNRQSEGQTESDEKKK